jgi:hypothetical protein
MAFVRAAVAHGRLAGLPLDAACDIACGSQEAADDLTKDLRHRVYLARAPGWVLVSQPETV